MTMMSMEYPAGVAGKLRRKKAKNTVRGPLDRTAAVEAAETASVFEPEIALSEFLRLRRAQGRSERTLKDYVKHVRQFYKKHPEAVDEKKLCDAAIAYMSERIAPATYNLRLSNLKNFFEYCRERGLLKTNPMDLFSKKKDPGRFLRITDEAVLDLLDRPDRNTFVGKRDYALMMLSIDTGIRPSEALQLMRDDIDLNGRIVTIRAHISKTREQRNLFLNPETARAIEELIHQRKRSWTRSIPMFPTFDGRPLSEREWADRMGEYCVGFPTKIRPYDLRHYFSQAYLRNGGEVFPLRDILGHKTLEMTQRYISLNGDDVRTDHVKASPVRKLFGGNEHPRKCKIGRPGNDALLPVEKKRAPLAAEGGNETMETLAGLFRSDPAAVIQFVSRMNDVMNEFSRGGRSR